MVFKFCFAVFLLESCQQNEQFTTDFSGSESAAFENISSQVSGSEFFEGEVSIQDCDRGNIFIDVKPKGRWRANRAYLIQREEEAI